MKELQLNAGAQKHIFQPDGKVAVMVNNARTIKGTWRSEAKGNETKESVLRYELDGQSQTPVPVRYGFNQFNQLTAAIPAAANGGADSETAVFLGQILIDDAHDLVYSVLTPEGASANNMITVYGDLRFSGDTSNLVIEMKNGEKAEIKGEKGLTGLAMLKAEKNLVQEFKGNDLLRFTVFTRNDLSTSPTRVPKKAQIEFVGKWDVNPDTGQLVFLSKVTGDITKPDVTIGFAGTFKAVTVGFAYFADKEGKQLVFNIKGEHRWNSTAAKWELSLGHSDKKFLASFKGKLEKTMADGQQFVLSGEMTLEHVAGKKTNIAFKVEGSYQFNKDNKLVFSVDIATSNGQLSYNLMVEGRFVFKSGTLVFQVRVSNKDPNSTVQIQIAFKGNEASLIKNLSLVLDIAPNKVKINFEFEMRMRWVDGILVKEKEKPLAA